MAKAHFVIFHQGFQLSGEKLRVEVKNFLLLPSNSLATQNTLKIVYQKENFNWKIDSFSQWKKNNHWNLELFLNIFRGLKHFEKPNRNMLNYEVDL